MLVNTRRSVCVQLFTSAMSSRSILTVVFLCCLCLLNGTTGFMFRGKLDELPGHESQCYVKKNDVTTFFANRYYDVDNCIKYTCDKEEGATLLLTGAGCGVIYAAPPCTITKTGKGRYPLCCPQIRCPDEGKLSQN